MAPFEDLKPVKKFEKRTIATNRIWSAIQKLGAQAAPGTLEAYGPEDAESAAAAAPAANPAPTAKLKARKAKAAGARKPRIGSGPKAPREGTAKATVIAMLERKGGATLRQIQDATGWQAHTVRGFISVLTSKGGMTINSTRRKSDKARVYEVAR